jgi:hypothetical protein
MAFVRFSAVRVRLAQRARRLMRRKANRGLRRRWSQVVIVPLPFVADAVALAGRIYGRNRIDGRGRSG